MGKNQKEAGEMSGILTGQGITYRAWRVKKPRAAAIMVHGLGASSSRFEELSVFLNKSAISCYAVELEGHGVLAGGEGHMKGHIRSASVFHAEIKKLKGLALKECKAVPFFLIGESMGGLFAASHALFHDSAYSGMILSVPAFKDRFSWNFFQRAAIFLKLFKSPDEGIEAPYRAEDLTSDPAMLKKIKKDRSEHKRASPSLLKEMFFEMMRTSALIRRLSVPLLMLLSGKDALIDTEYSKKIYARVKCPKELILYDDSLHALLIEKNRKEIYRDILRWIKTRFPHL